MSETTDGLMPVFGRPRLLVADRSADNVGLTLDDLPEGAVCEADPVRIPITQDIPAGHKVALTDIRPGQAIVKYGAVIGYATAPITPGSHVHVHNVEVRVRLRPIAATPGRPPFRGRRQWPRRATISLATSDPAAPWRPATT